MVRGANGNFLAQGLEDLFLTSPPSFRVANKQFCIEHGFFSLYDNFLPSQALKSLTAFYLVLLQAECLIETFNR